jgi:hypothetical protein
MKQTAVSWLIQQIQSDTFCDHMQGVRYWDKDTLMEFLEKAKQMEKEQKELDYDIGYVNGVLKKYIDGQEYYNQTYGKE